MAMVGMSGPFWYMKPEDDLIFPPEDDQPNHEGELCLNGYSDDVQGQPDVDGIQGQTNLDYTLGEPDLDDIQWQPNREEEEQDESLDAGKGPVGLAPMQLSRQARQISKATLEQLSKDDPTSQLLIKAREEWGLNLRDLEKASGVNEGTIRSAQRDSSKRSPDVLERIVYVLKNGPGCQLPNRKQQLKEEAAQVDRIGFALIVKKTRQAKKLSQKLLSEKCTQILKELSHLKFKKEISQSTINRIEKSKNNVAPACLAIVAHVLGLKPENYNISPLQGIQSVIDYPPEEDPTLQFYKAQSNESQLVEVVDPSPEDDPTLQFYKAQSSHESELLERDELKTEIPCSHKGNKRKAPQISEARLEQLSIDSITSQHLINAQKAWGLSVPDFADACGVSPTIIRKALKDITKIGSGVKQSIVYVLNNGPNYQLLIQNKEKRSRSSR